MRKSDLYTKGGSGVWSVVNVCLFREFPEMMFLPNLFKYTEISYQRLKQILPAIWEIRQFLDRLIPSFASHPGVDFHGFQCFGTRRYAEATPRSARKGGGYSDERRRCQYGMCLKPTWPKKKSITKIMSKAI